MLLQNRQGPIQLLHQHHPRQLVWQRHFAQRKREASLAPRFYTESVTSADREQHWRSIQLLAFQKLSQFFRRKLLPSRIEQHKLMTVIFLLPFLLPLAAGQGQNRRLVLQRHSRHFGIVRDTLQILIGERLNGRLFRLTDPCDFNLHKVIANQAFFFRAFLGAAAASFPDVAFVPAARRALGLASNSDGSSRLADFHSRSRS